MARVGFIGLGIMGAPMAANLVAAGHEVIGYNRSRAKVDTLVGKGGVAASSAAEAARGADAVITMLPDSPDVQRVVLDEQGVLAAMSGDALLIDCSTIRPEVSRQVAEAASATGVRALDAPVSGGQGGAVDGTLSIMVGGEAAAFDSAAPFLDAMGGTVVHVGPAGAGQTVKAANQLIVAGTIELVAESLVFLEAHGVDSDAAINVLAGGMAGNRILDRKATAMARRDFDPGFRVELHHKDLGIVTDAAREAGVTIPLGALAGQLMAALNAQGHGTLDHGALLKVVEQLSGRA